MAAAEPMPTVDNSTSSSPKELIAAYLNKQGMPLTNANYALALKANAENPGTITGLANMDTVTSEGDPGFVGPSKPRGGGGGGERPIPVPPIPPPGSPRTGETVTTTPPDGMSLSDIVALMLGGGAAGAANWLRRPPAVPDGKLSAAPEPPRIAGPEPQLRIEGPKAPLPASAAPPVVVTPPPNPAELAPIETAMQRALQPGAGAAPPPTIDAVPPEPPPAKPTLAQKLQGNLKGAGVGGKRPPKFR